MFRFPHLADAAAAAVAPKAARNTFAGADSAGDAFFGDAFFDGARR